MKMKLTFSTNYKLLMKTLYEQPPRRIFFEQITVLSKIYPNYSKFHATIHFINKKKTYGGRNLTALTLLRWINTGLLNDRSMSDLYGTRLVKWVYVSRDPSPSKRCAYSSSVYVLFDAECDCCWRSSISVTWAGTCPEKCRLVVKMKIQKWCVITWSFNCSFIRRNLKLLLKHHVITHLFGFLFLYRCHQVLCSKKLHRAII